MMDNRNFDELGEKGCIFYFFFMILMVNILLSVICFKFVKVVCKILVQKLCFVFFVVLLILVVIGLIFGLYLRIVDIFFGKCILLLVEWRDKN